MLPSQLQQALEKMPDESRLLMEAIVVFYETKVKGLEDRIKELEDQI